MTSPMLSSTFIWKNDASAGGIPAHVHYDDTSSNTSRAIGKPHHSYHAYPADHFSSHVSRRWLRPGIDRHDPEESDCQFGEQRLRSRNSRVPTLPSSLSVRRAHPGRERRVEMVPRRSAQAHERKRHRSRRKASRCHGALGGRPTGLDNSILFLDNSPSLHH